MAAGLAIGAFVFWDTSVVTVASGHRDVTVSIVQNETKGASSISFTTIDSNRVQTVIEDYPAPEPTFESIPKGSFVLSIPFSFKVSRFGRDLGYAEALDTALFHIVYEDKAPEFRTVPIPNRNDRAQIEIKL